MENARRVLCSPKHELGCSRGRWIPFLRRHSFLCLPLFPLSCCCTIFYRLLFDISRIVTVLRGARIFACAFRTRRLPILRLRAICQLSRFAIGDLSGRIFREGPCTAFVSNVLISRADSMGAQFCRKLEIFDGALESVCAWWLLAAGHFMRLAFVVTIGLA